jgi:PAS domain S-box-containing protein
MPSASSLTDKIERQLADGTTRPIHYLAGIVIPLLAAALQAALRSALGEGYHFVLFYPAVMVAAWYGGLRPGLLATALSVALTIGFFLPSHGELLPNSGVGGLAPGIIFVASGILMSLLMGVMHQIVTKLRHAHEDLYEQREWLGTTLKSIGDAVVVTDRNGVVNFMNGEAERLTGWSSNEAKNKPLRAVFRIISEESRKSVDDPVEKVFREKRVVGLANHTLLISKDGVEWPIEDSAAPIYDESKDTIMGVVLVFHDATELRRNQRSLKAHADELEHKVFERTVSLQRTVNDLEAFSYSISHDLRSPLRAMLGYSQALLEDFTDLPELATDYLQKIAKSAERLDHLVQDLLAFSRVSHEEDSIAPVDLDRLIRDIVQQYPNFQGNVDIIIDGKLPVVLGHETALTQVVSNLLANAVKFVPPEKRPQVKVQAAVGVHVVRIEFIDNGIGIAPENQERIFKMFEQVNPAGTYSGTGIGLAVVKKAVEKMQGSLGVESRVGEGSKFWIELLKAKEI